MNAPLPGTPVGGGLPVWGQQLSFFRRNQAAFWLFAVLFVFSGLSVLNEQLVYLDVFPAGWLLSVFLLALYVVPVAAAIYALDLFEREPLSLLLAAFVWGGVVAVGLSAPTNGAWAEIVAKLGGAELAREWGPALVAPAVEETFKFLGVVVIYLIARSEIDDLFDGFLYGALVGLGFAAVENVQYFVQAIAATGGGDQLGPVLEMFLLRVVIVGAYMHVLWTGIAGLGLAYYVTRPGQRRGRRALVLLALFGVAVLAHLVWNSPLLSNLVTAGLGGQLAFGLLKGSPFFVFLAVMVVLAQRREHRWFALATQAHLGEDVLTRQELVELGGLLSRWRARRLARRQKGLQAARLLGRLQREQINLGMICARAGADDHPAVVAQCERIRQIRAELAALPNLPSAAVPTRADGPAAHDAARTERERSPSSFAGWTPTHSVPPAGMLAWAVPDPTQPATLSLPGGLPVALVEQAGAWARVVAPNAWQGWVDGRLLVPIESRLSEERQ